MLRLGTRQSPLALAQADWVATRLREHHPGLEVERVLITTSGDRQTARFTGNTTPEATAKGGLKALFTKEIEESLLDQRIDLAVHSLKDMASELPAGLTLGAVPLREDPRDAWISRTGVRFADLPLNARVATSAVRRKAQLLIARPDLQIEAMRGNVDTRLRKLQSSDLDGIVLAAAGLRRLGLTDRITDALDPALVLPAVGQGCLALEIREADAATAELVAVLNHPFSAAAATAERAFLAALGGSCQTPIAAYADVTGSQIRMRGGIFGKTPDLRYVGEETGGVTEAAELGRRLAGRLLANGAGTVLSSFG